MTRHIKMRSKNISDVDNYIAQLPLPQQEIVRRVRTLITKRYPELTESLKWHVPIYSLNTTNHLLGFQVFKGHVNLNFFSGAQLNDPRNILVGVGKRVRHVSFLTINDIDRTALQALIDQAIVNEPPLLRGKRLQRLDQ